MTVRFYTAEERAVLYPCPFCDAPAGTPCTDFQGADLANRVAQARASGVPTSGILMQATADNPKPLAHAMRLVGTPFSPPVGRPYRTPAEIKALAELEAGPAR